MIIYIKKIQNYLFVKSKEDFLSPEAKKALHDAEEREYDKKMNTLFPKLQLNFKSVRISLFFQEQ
mgnify:CR=1 FL=1